MFGKEQTKYNKLISYLKSNNAYKELLEYLKEKEVSFSIFDDDLLVDIVNIIIDNEKNYKNSLDTAKDLYKIIVNDRNDSKQKNLFLKIYSNYLLSANTYEDIDWFNKIYNLFENKDLILGIFGALDEIDELDGDILDLFYEEYMLVARRYYVDEIAFYSSVISLIPKIEKNKHKKNIVKELIKDTLKTDMKIAGVVTIDEDIINELSKSIEVIENKQLELNEHIDSCNENQRILDEKLINSIDRIDNMMNSLNNKFENVDKNDLCEKNANNESNKENNQIEDISETEIENIGSILDENLINDILVNVKKKLYYLKIIDEDKTDKLFKEYVLSNHNALELDDIKLLIIVINKINELDRIGRTTIKYLLDSEQYEKVKYQVVEIYEFLSKLYYALDDDTLYCLKKFISNDQIPDYTYISRYTVNMFSNVDYYLNLCINYNSIFRDYLFEDKLYELNYYYEHNKDFDIEKSLLLSCSYEKIMRISVIFGRDIICNLTEESNPNLFRSLQRVHISSIQKLYDLFLINPKFELYRSSILLNIYDIEYVFKDDEIAYFTIKQQEIVTNLFNYFIGLPEMPGQYKRKIKYILRKIIFNEIDIDNEIFEKLVKYYNESKLDIDDYIYLKDEDRKIINDKLMELKILNYSNRLSDKVTVMKDNAKLKKSIKNDLKNFNKLNQKGSKLEDTSESKIENSSFKLTNDNKYILSESNFSQDTNNRLTALNIININPNFIFFNIPNINLVFNITEVAQFNIKQQQICFQLKDSFSRLNEFIDELPGPNLSLAVEILRTSIYNEIDIDNEMFEKLVKYFNELKLDIDDFKNLNDEDRKIINDKLMELKSPSSDIGLSDKVTVINNNVKLKKLIKKDIKKYRE